MRCYLIRNTQVTVLVALPESIPADAILIESIKSIDPRRFPSPLLVTIWNDLPGASPIKRFKDRPAALKRVWAALEELPITSSRTDSKQALVVALIKRPEGASMEALINATGWQPHSVRGLLSGAIKKKLGLKVSSQKDGADRIYRTAA